MKFIVAIFSITLLFSFQTKKINKVWLGEGVRNVITTDKDTINGKEVIDTNYILHLSPNEQTLHWQLFLDSNKTILLHEHFVKNDTTYDFKYFLNGKPREFEKRVNHIWIYGKSWYKNGQVISDGFLNLDTYHKLETFHRNGKIAHKSFMANNQYWDTLTSWYENGNKKFEETYTIFNHNIPLDSNKTSKLLSVKEWDKNGKLVK